MDVGKEKTKKEEAFEQISKDADNSLKSKMKLYF